MKRMTMGIAKGQCRKRRMAFTIPVLLLMACGSPGTSIAPVLDRQVDVVAGPKAPLKSLMGPAATVFITLDPECPFCQLYGHDFQDIATHYAAQGLKVVGLYAGPYMEREKAERFSADAGFTFPQVMDNDCTLSLALKARVTPEVFLTDTTGKVVYHGAFDDRAVRQGRKKYTAQKHYLADAIDAFLSTGKAQSDVTAVGCIVECGK